MTIYLASKSPRRLELCQQIGLEVSVLEGASVDETLLPRGKPRQYAERVARLKADAAIRALPAPKERDSIIVADTVLALGRRILPKTEDAAIAEDYLHMLSGRNARIWGALVVVQYQNGLWQQKIRISETRIRFARLPKAEIMDYLASGDWRGCAGAIAIQGKAARFVLRLQGSYSNAVGLDVALLWRLLV